MTSTVNGIGTKLFGSRQLTYEDYTKHMDHLQYDYNDVIYKIATEAFVFFWIPIIPLNTIIYIDIKSVRFDKNERTNLLDRIRFYETLENDKVRTGRLKKGVFNTNMYQVCSTYHVNWRHVKSSVTFYFSPILLPFLILYNVFDIIRNAIRTETL
ncbi:MAG: hypothetical protein QG646_2681 [Euryarchaeota archaeon]|nr:hypothetical protein [Euryarchaeota archaeon]